MARRRSPHSPHVALDQALVWLRRAHRHVADRVVSREEFAGTLGHRSVSGPAATKLATLRAYGLIETSGDGVRITSDAVAATHVGDPDARREATRRLARQPSVFGELYGLEANEPLIRLHLINLGFPSFAAARVAHVFLETCRVAETAGASPTRSEAD